MRMRAHATSANDSEQHTLMRALEHWSCSSITCKLAHNPTLCEASQHCLAHAAPPPQLADFQYDTVKNVPFMAPNGKSYKIPGDTHKGYAGGFAALWPAVAAQLGDGTKQSVMYTTFTFTGHSQGGPLATLLAAAVRALAACC